MLNYNTVQRENLHEALEILMVMLADNFDKPSASAAYQYANKYYCNIAIPRTTKTVCKEQLQTILKALSNPSIVSYYLGKRSYTLESKMLIL